MGWSGFAGLRDEGEGVAGEGYLGAPGAEDYFHDVHADGDVGVAQHPEPGLSTADQGFFLGFVHGVGGAAQSFRRAGFYFDEDEGLLFAADQVYLAAGIGAEVAVEDFVAVAAQVAGGGLLSLAAQAEVGRLRRRRREYLAQRGEKFCDESGRGHGF